VLFIHHVLSVLHVTTDQRRSAAEMPTDPRRPSGASMQIELGKAAACTRELYEGAMG